VVDGHNQTGDAASHVSSSHQDVEAWHGRDTTLDVKVGPLLNYRRMEDGEWFGSVLVVTQGGSGQVESEEVPELRLRTAGIAKKPAQDHGNSSHHNGETNGKKSQNEYDSSAYETRGVVENSGSSKESTVKGTKLYSDSRNTFWRFDLAVQMQDEEIKCEYSIPSLKMKGKKSDRQSFFVPASHDSMRIMFHSCNGFSVGTDEEAWSGAALWNDVQRVHALRPFHVM
jgi:hypothetical protein